MVYLFGMHCQYVHDNLGAVLLLKRQEMNMFNLFLLIESNET